MSIRRRQINVQPLSIPSTVAETVPNTHSANGAGVVDSEVKTPTRSKHPSGAPLYTFAEEEKGANRTSGDQPAEQADKPEESSFSVDLSLISRGHGRRDKAAQLLGIPHHASMEPIPVNRRTSLASVRSAPAQPPSTPTHVPVVH